MTVSAASPLPDDLFAYGSLMCDDIMTVVAGIHLRSTTAILRGYRRFLVRGEQYPGLIVDPEGAVQGIVYHNIPAECWRRLDRFEGEMYDRAAVVPCDGKGRALPACCYIVKPPFQHLLTATEWSYSAFLQDGKQKFLNQYCGFKVID